MRKAKFPLTFKPVSGGNIQMSGKTGYLFVVAAALLWAISGTASKFIFAGGITPVELVQFRTAGSAAILAVVLGVRKPSLLLIAPKKAGYFILLGALLAVTQFTYLFAISKTLVAVAILLQYQAPLVVAIYTYFIVKEKLSIPTVVAMFCSLLGCYLVVGGYNLNILSMSKIGILSGLCSAVTFAFYTIASESGMRQYSPWTVLFCALTVAAVILNIVYPPFHALNRSHTFEMWWWIFFVTLFGTILPFAFYNLGIQRIRPAHASVTATLEPIAASIISYLFLGEVLDPWQSIGSSIVITAIIILQQNPHRADVNQAH
jgi:drug/metabolite transporter (DMT)-like permease